MKNSKISKFFKNLFSCSTPEPMPEVSTKQESHLLRYKRLSDIDKYLNDIMSKNFKVVDIQVLLSPNTPADRTLYDAIIIVENK